MTSEASWQRAKAPSASATPHERPPGPERRKFPRAKHCRTRTKRAERAVPRGSLGVRPAWLQDVATEPPGRTKTASAPLTLFLPRALFTPCPCLGLPPIPIFVPCDSCSSATPPPPPPRRYSSVCNSSSSLPGLLSSSSRTTRGLSSRPHAVGRTFAAATSVAGARLGEGAVGVRRAVWQR